MYLISLEMAKSYERPEVIREVRTETECAFLLGSVVDNLAPVESTGQMVQEYDFSAEQSFNHNWE